MLHDIENKEHKANDVALLVQLKWNEMTCEEQVIATSDVIKKLKEKQEKKGFALQNITKSCFSDAKGNLASIHTQV